MEGVATWFPYTETVSYKSDDHQLEFAVGVSAGDSSERCNNY